jgi:hypothetical protein
VRFPFLISLGCLALSACNDDRDGYAHYYDDGVSTEVTTEDIDLGVGLMADPGSGVGLTVDAASGGVWRISTTCDTPATGYLCEWDLVASVPQGSGGLFVADDSTLEKYDGTFAVDDDAVRIVMENGSDEDSVTLSGPDGIDLTLDVILDGNHDSSLVSWNSHGTIRSGARSDPLQLHPVTP